MQPRAGKESGVLAGSYPDRSFHSEDLALIAFEQPRGSQHSSGRPLGDVGVSRLPHMLLHSMYMMAKAESP